MSIKNVIVLLLFSVLYIGCGPKSAPLPSYKAGNQYKEKYQEFLDNGSIFLLAGYNYMMETSSSGSFIEKTFYPDTKQMTHYYTYSDKERATKNGPAKEWWDDGSFRFVGQFKDNEMDGVWKDYGLSTSGQYKTGKYLKSKKQGNWMTYDEYGTKVSEYEYDQNEKHGAYKIYDENGRLLEKGIYENDELKSRDVIDSETEAGGKDLKVAETMPEFKGCEEISDKEERKKCSENKMLRFIYSDIKYPMLAREEGIEGRSYAQFIVNKKGKVQDIVILRGVCKEIKAEVYLVVKSLPEWHSGMQNGKPVKVLFTLPVTFKLN